MERFTKKDQLAGHGVHYVSEDDCFDVWSVPKRFMGAAIDRLAAYEDTGLTPEEIKELCTDDVAKIAKLFRRMIEDGSIDHLQELLDDEKEGRLVVLDSPMLPLVWGDEERNTILCPNCKHDLMGGFPDADTCEWHMYQCPYCGQPLSDKAVTREEAEAALRDGGANHEPSR